MTNWNTIQDYFAALAISPTQALPAQEMGKLAALLGTRYTPFGVDVEVKCLSLILSLEGMRSHLVIENIRPNWFRVGLWQDKHLTSHWEVPLQDMPISLMCYLLTSIQKPM